MEMNGISAVIILFGLTLVCGVHIPDNELLKFTERLLSLDSNNAGRWMTIELQNRIPYDATNDRAPNRLIHLRKELFSIPTISKIIPLYDNYDVNSLNDEVVTAVEKQEENAMLDSFLNTTVMKETRSFLQKYGLLTGDFKKVLSDMWFTIYSRGKNRMGSSAFEHIFLAELKRGDIAGLHNWLYFSYEENRGNVNYLGWMKKLEFPSQANTGILKIKYSWGTSLKPSNSMFYGTSPELEMALYSICFLARPNDKCHISLDGKKLFIQTYAFNYKGKSLIGSAYPVI